MPLWLRDVQRQFRKQNSYMKIIPILVIMDSGKVIINSGLSRKVDRHQSGIGDHLTSDLVIGLHRNR